VDIRSHSIPPLFVAAPLFPSPIISRGLRSTLYDSFVGTPRSPAILRTSSLSARIQSSAAGLMSRIDFEVVCPIVRATSLRRDILQGCREGWPQRFVSESKLFSQVVQRTRPLAGTFVPLIKIIRKHALSLNFRPPQLLQPGCSLFFCAPG